MSNSLKIEFLLYLCFMLTLMLIVTSIDAHQQRKEKRNALNFISTHVVLDADEYKSLIKYKSDFLWGNCWGNGGT